METLGWLGITLLIVDILAIVLYILITRLRKKYVRTNLLVASADTKRTVEEERYVINVFNADKNDAIWNCSETELRWHAMDYVVDGATFERNPDIPGSLSVSLPKEKTFQTELMITLSVKYNNIKISIAGYDNEYKVLSIPDSELEKAKKLTYRRVGDSSHNLHEMFQDFEHSDKYFRFNAKELSETSKGAHVHINESKSTTKSLRYQMILPKDYRDKVGFIPEEYKIFYVFEGNTYEFETKFLGNQDDFYEWDLINLEPNTTYCGMSYSSNYDTNIRPSQTFYGITKDYNGDVPNLDGANIAKPLPTHKKHRMWTEQEAIVTFGEKWTKLQYEIITKKHFELESPENYVRVQEAERYFDKYPWLKTGKQD